MAVKNKVQKPIRIKDFWPLFRRRMVWAILGWQLLATALVGMALVITDVLQADSPLFWVILFTVAMSGIGVNMLSFSISSQPTRDVAAAITHISGELTDTTPPNPNARQYSKNGFKQILQTIYELSSADRKDTDKPADARMSILSSALANTSCGFVVMGSSGEILFANEKAPVYQNKDGKLELSLLFDNEDTLSIWLEDTEAHSVRAKKIWHRISDKVIGEDGRRIFDILATYEKGSEAQVVLVFFDRTEDYVPEEEDLDFIAFAAHELRGPITVIRGYLDVLSDEIGTSLAPDQQELLSRLIVSSNRLSGYINNILNASRYDRRHLKVHLSEHHLSDIYGTINDDMQMRAAAQNRLLSIELPSDLPTIAADYSSVSEVLGNFIDNAIKYSNEGGVVKVSARVDGDFVEVSIVDRGIGIPARVINNLFHKFYRSHRSRETVAGTGIGLYICKAIIESHGGTVGVRSVEGEGSTFTFTLPIYSTIADKLKSDGQGNNDKLIENGKGWIKNHAMYRG